MAGTASATAVAKELVRIASDLSVFSRSIDTFLAEMQSQQQQAAATQAVRSAELTRKAKALAKREAEFVKHRDEVLRTHDELFDAVFSDELWDASSAEEESPGESRPEILLASPEAAEGPVEPATASRSPIDDNLPTSNGPRSVTAVEKVKSLKAKIDAAAADSGPPSVNVSTFGTRYSARDVRLGSQRSLSDGVADAALPPSSQRSAGNGASRAAPQRSASAGSNRFFVPQTGTDSSDRESVVASQRSPSSGGTAAAANAVRRQRSPVSGATESSRIGADESINPRPSERSPSGGNVARGYERSNEPQQHQQRSASGAQAGHSPTGTEL